MVFADDATTITNYYPSPYGSYLKLTSDQMVVGSGYRYLMLPSALPSAPPTDGLIVQGQVGIGTSAPVYGGLDVNGEIAAKDIWVKSKSRWVTSADYFVSS